MIASKPISDLLTMPLDPGWTMDGLGEQLLATIASQGSDNGQEFVFGLNSTTDRQAHRLLRPLIACLATKSAAESGTPANLYGGNLAFKRLGPDGPVWIVGEYENRPGSVRVALRRSSSAPEASETDPKSPGAATV